MQIVLTQRVSGPTRRAQSVLKHCTFYTSLGSFLLFDLFLDLDRLGDTCVSERDDLERLHDERDRELEETETGEGVRCLRFSLCPLL